MALPLLIFEPLDLPPDINIILNDDINNYIFHKMNGEKSIYFTIQKNEKSGLESVLLDNFKKTNYKLFEHIHYNGNNVNLYLWKISDCNYERRFLKLEIIERLRLCRDESDLKNILEFIRQIPIEIQSDGDD
jgi:hypothetical protein